MKRIRQWLLVCGLFLAVSSVGCTRALREGFAEGLSGAVAGLVDALITNTAGPIVGVE